MRHYALHDSSGTVLSRGKTSRIADGEAMARRQAAGLYWGIVPPGYMIVDGEPVPGPDPAPSEGLRAELKAEIDIQAGIRRQRYITAVPGQDMVYAEKRAEAERVIAGATEDVPHIAAEAMISGRTLAEQAALVLAMAAQWTAISVAIETARLTAKAAIDAAASETEARSVRIDWSSILPTQGA